MSELPNLVLITIDSLRADHCGFMGYEKDTTPTLDRMAEEGVVFENAIAPAPSTPGSMSAVHTGKFLKQYYNDEDEVIVNRKRNIRRHLRDNPTISEVLQNRGYTTIGFSPNPFTSRYFGFQSGFDHYTDFLDTHGRVLGNAYDRLFRQFISGHTQLTPFRLLLNYFEGEEIFKDWEEYYEGIMRQVTATSPPYFLWVFLLDTHLPYLLRRKYRDDVSWSDMWRYNLRLYFGNSDPFLPAEREQLLKLYDGTVRHVDRFVQRLRSDLGDSDPIVFLHGDHGEAFGEHGTYGHEPYTYEENVHVPYVIINGRESGRESEPVSLRRIGSDIGSYAGVRFPGENSQHNTRGSILTNPFGVRSALRNGSWKFMWSTDPSTDRELYHLDSDPRETNNLADVDSNSVDDWERLARHRMSSEHEKYRITEAIRSLRQKATL